MLLNYFVGLGPLCKALQKEFSPRDELSKDGFFLRKTRTMSATKTLLKTGQANLSPYNLTSSTDF